MNMFIKHHGPTHLPHDFSGEVPIRAWRNYGPQYQTWKKSNEAVAYYKFLQIPLPRKLSCTYSGGHIHS